MWTHPLALPLAITSWKGWKQLRLCTDFIHAGSCNDMTLRTAACLAFAPLLAISPGSSAKYTSTCRGYAMEPMTKALGVLGSHTARNTVR